MIAQTLINTLDGAGVIGQATSNSTITQMANAICSFVEPLAGHSQIVSLVFVVALGVMVFLWFMNENKEGVIVWLLRAGLVMAILINIFTLPSLIGLPNPCA